MGRDRKSKHKLSRREGRDLFGTGGESLQRRLEQPPGMPGRRAVRKESVYGEQLREKQKVKRMYGLREPNRDEIDPDIQEQRIVEFYSR